MYKSFLCVTKLGNTQFVSLNQSAGIPHRKAISEAPDKTFQLVMKWTEIHIDPSLFPPNTV